MMSLSPLPSTATLSLPPRFGVPDGPELPGAGAGADPVPGADEVFVLGPDPEHEARARLAAMPPAPNNAPRRVTARAGQNRSGRCEPRSGPCASGIATPQSRASLIRKHDPPLPVLAAATRKVSQTEVGELVTNNATVPAAFTGDQCLRCGGMPHNAERSTLSASKRSSRARRGVPDRSTAPSTNASTIARAGVSVMNGAGPSTDEVSNTAAEEATGLR